MKKRRWQGQMTAELLKNYSKREPMCRHFLTCGGCSFQDFEYKDQLEVKAKKVGELFDGCGICHTEILHWRDSAPSIFGGEFKEWGYRTRMDLVVGKAGIGLRKKRRFDEIEFLQECWLIDNNVLQFLKEVYQKGIEVGLIPYDLVTHEGEWRYLSVRINEKNELMLIFVTKRGVENKISKLKTQISKSQLTTQNFSVKSIYHVVNDGLGDSNFGEIKKYWGEEYLQYSICNIQYAIGPNTFFQNNIPLVNKLVDKIVDNVDEDDRVLDLYCGVGTLSLPVAKKCREVLGVELMEESIGLARKNAVNNNIDNVEFEAKSVEDIFDGNSKFKAQNSKPQLKTQKPNLNEYNVLMLDPPRKGLEKVAGKLLEYDFDKIVYMSCNPLSLVKDLQVLVRKWQIEEVSLWDLYPQTPHVEVLVLLRNKKQETRNKKQVL